VGIAFITWLWGDKYDSSYVEKLAAGVRRHYSGDHRFVVFSDNDLNLSDGIEVKPIANPELIGQGCFCRLRMFDPVWQEFNGFDDRIVSIDLDAIITGRLDELFREGHDFRILQGVNSLNPCPYNCSVMMLKAGAHSEIWSQFSMEKAATIKQHEFPDDQGWIWHVLPKANGWKGGEASGIYAFEKPGWPHWQGRDKLPRNARIVAFVGWRKPQQFLSLPWMMQHWRIA
jgi:hypothetical protein